MLKFQAPQTFIRFNLFSLALDFSNAISNWQREAIVHILLHFFRTIKWERKKEKNVFNRHCFYF